MSAALICYRNNTGTGDAVEGEVAYTAGGLKKELTMASFYDFEMASITGEVVDFSQFKGQACLLVNVASA